jgi:hypothetical protein
MIGVIYKTENSFRSNYFSSWGCELYGAFKQELLGMNYFRLLIIRSKSGIIVFRFLQSCT